MTYRVYEIMGKDWIVTRKITTNKEEAESLFFYMRSNYRKVFIEEI